MIEREKILILGGTGMLGHALFRFFSADEQKDVYATVRTDDKLHQWFAAPLLTKIISGVDTDNFDTVLDALKKIKPAVIINCIGMIKQQPLAEDPLTAITINAQLPHKIALACCGIGARLIQMSTDCVFDGKKGMYKESDQSNADDLYGKTKYLGEVTYPHSITLRTSIIGHELKGRYGLIEWFLSQKEKVRGFRRAIYSGFPTMELAAIIRNYILPNPQLSGVYHVSSAPISKYDLLAMVAKEYGKQIAIEPNDQFAMDRSLDSSLFRSLTGYNPPSWEMLVRVMHDDFLKNRAFYAY